MLNKVDLPSADPERVQSEIEEIIGISAENILEVSAKSGVGVEELLEQLIQDIPSPQGENDAPLKALIIDSWFDNYLGVVSLVRIVDGEIKVGDKIRVMSSSRDFIVDQLGIFTPKRNPKKILSTGEVGYVVAGIKEILSLIHI